MKIPSFIIDNMTWSYSRLKSYDMCPYGWLCHYIMGEEEEPRFYTEVGSFMHKLLEQYFRKQMELQIVYASLDAPQDVVVEKIKTTICSEKTNIKLHFYTHFSDAIKGTRPPGNIVPNYIQKLGSYIDNLEPFNFTILDVERKVNFSIGGYNFVGFIDILGQDNDGNLIIIDHKSRDLKPRSKRKKPTQKDAELDSMLRQLYLYAGAVKQEYGEFPKQLCFNCFKNGEFITEDFDEDKYNEAVEWALGVIHDIKEEDVWNPDIDFFKCKWICGQCDCVYKQ